ncbi:SdiA-regulated domain-containing protein [Balneolales bacterium ANBcel1]|nr:SdiA-regulated domain-containing protein [Balneolales bacterium ANBcel1]
MFRFLLIILTFGFTHLACSDPVSDDPDEDGVVIECGGQPGDNSGFEFSDVVISEFMVVQDGIIADPDYDGYSGWIELHNREFEEVDVSGWIIAGVECGVYSDRIDTIPDQTAIPPDGFLLIWTSGESSGESAVHTRFQLPEEGAQIGLYGPASANTPQIDTVSYHKLDVHPQISMGRAAFRAEHKGFLVPMTQPTPGNRNLLERLELQSHHSLALSDPSGLSPDYDGDGFWSVSDDPGGSIYRLDQTGQILEELRVNGHDMEGISQHPGDLTLYVAEERLRQVVQYATDGTELQRFDVEVEQQRVNDGLEGISVNPSTGTIYLVNKQNPRVFIELELTGDGEARNLQYRPVDFGADPESDGVDLSGLFYDSETGLLWMASDQARAVFILDTTGRPLAAFAAPAGNRDLEGISVLRQHNAIYTVSDEQRMLYKYAMPDPLIHLPPNRP